MNHNNDKGSLRHVDSSGLFIQEVTNADAIFVATSQLLNSKPYGSAFSRVEYKYQIPEILHFSLFN